ncbi:MAG: hypothetical protein IPK58_15800 [Acidobacteria bacterium]|nr:hypothetical protein [Acidobacteriota bacterium]
MGYEIRLVANSQLELVQLQWTIRAAGLKPGNPYTKANRWVVPIYGRDTMERFVAWIEKRHGVPNATPPKGGTPNGRPRQNPNGRLKAELQTNPNKIRSYTPRPDSRGSRVCGR